MKTFSTQKPIPASYFKYVIAAHALVATLGSLVLVMQGASVAHYFGSNKNEALLQVGAGCVLIVMWAYLAGGILWGVLTSRLPKVWLLTLLWAAIVLPYLLNCPLGYVGDVSEFVMGLSQ